MAELLSPAGDKECFMAALAAGADAIYVGGAKYGARAYAKNFAQEDLTECLRAAHLLDKKVYLTVNTLMKEEELDQLVSFLKPYYEEGLDGVIIQDLGALLRIREAFPGLELHASTQMTVTGPRAAQLLKEYGVSRVVPARELSLDEISVIKKETGLEIETFVHGAMCYGYSGQCLFSSTMGERSGNRGRCAGPCRLPYRTEYMGRQLNRQNELYQLSLKDLCTLEILPQLLEAGIDSFKIEGRMKSPEYVSFVTGMYRKYMDLYTKNPEKYRVSDSDIELLKNKFSRGSIQPGYYFTHNGRELVTMDKPGYQSFAGLEATEKAEPADLRDLECPKIDLIGHFTAHKNEPVCLMVYKEGALETTIAVTGAEAGEAQKCAATPDDVKKQLCKTGNTFFSFKEISFEMDQDLFLPNKELNELRRNALGQME
nr:U32 family peptidase [Lachnospiraceae bacterium]